jgi:class 3 adenylate cyclase
MLIGYFASSWTDSRSAPRSPNTYRPIWSNSWQITGKIVLGGEERAATVLFSDVRGFTAISSFGGVKGDSR